MKFAKTLFAAAAIAAIASVPARADGLSGGSSSGDHGSSSSSGGDHGHMSTSSSGSDGHGPTSSSSSGGTSIPEPSDAILLLMGATGIVIGRKLHARARRRP